ncbi:MAG TPA: hypothetical protein VIZ69_06590, partial [Thermoanaerobaculia bacterium]
MRLARVVLGAVAILGSGSALLTAQPAAPDPARLIGLWGATRTFGPAIRGELTLAVHGAAWTASIGGT